MSDLGLDAIIDQTLETLVSGAIEEGLIHSGQAGGSFVDLDPGAMLARLRDVHYYVGLVLRGSPLVAEVERLQAEDERKGDTIAERVDQLDWAVTELRRLRAVVLSEVEFLTSLGTEEDSSMVAGWPEATAAFDRLTRAASGDAEFVAHARADVPALVVEVERLRAAVALHQPEDVLYVDTILETTYIRPACSECGEDWPCSTARAAGVDQ